jgi:uncharacterized phage protein (predicted DNA packaging)
MEMDVLKTYLRIDGGEEDKFLALLVSAAENDLKASGVPDDMKSDEMYDLATMLYVSLHYENRDPSIQIDKLNTAYQSLILKLKSY